MLPAGATRADSRDASRRPSLLRAFAPLLALLVRTRWEALVPLPYRKVKQEACLNQGAHLAASETLPVPHGSCVRVLLEPVPWGLFGGLALWHRNCRELLIDVSTRYICTDGIEACDSPGIGNSPL
jgi:hypothetical protein